MEVDRPDMKGKERICQNFSIGLIKKLLYASVEKNMVRDERLSVLNGQQALSIANWWTSPLLRGWI